MIRQLIKKINTLDFDQLNSGLFNEQEFYPAFLKDLAKARNEVIIESPFVTNKRVEMLLPVLKKLKNRHVRVTINTRAPSEHDSYLRHEAEQALEKLQAIGVQVIFTHSHHRKMAIVDRNILWEGSLNILSQNNSKEVMRRTESTSLAWQMIRFTRLDSLIN